MTLFSKLTKIILAVIWLSALICCMLVLFGSFEFAAKSIRILCLFITLPGTCLLFSLFVKEKRNAFIAFWIVLASSAIGYRILTFFEGGGYKEQNILYINRADEDSKIIFQMEDIGAFGYNNRTVEFKNFGPLNYVKKVTFPDRIDQKVWRRTAINVNELNLKY